MLLNILKKGATTKVSLKGTSINSRRYRLRITIRANKAKTEGNSGLLARFLTILARILTLRCAAMN
jgi:hypothetical protein